MKDFFNIDDDYLEDEESEEAKQLKEKIELSGHIDKYKDLLEVSPYFDKKLK